jgi:hypothetical protein
LEEKNCAPLVLDTTKSRVIKPLSKAVDSENKEKREFLLNEKNMIFALLGRYAA